MRGEHSGKQPFKGVNQGTQQVFYRGANILVAFQSTSRLFTTAT